VFTVDGEDVRRMTGSVFIDGSFTERASSRFWVLLVLAATIATAGVIADSTATVIGAMIVAPLMTPILGTSLALVLADRIHLVKSILYVVSGALLVIAIAFLFGAVTHRVDDYAGNSQIAARISPRLIDLIAALATGTVGAFALVRSDISDTLPGVAIAISLVPPLAVVGLLLEVGRTADAAQAGLLFGTNVAAILLTGTLVFLAYRVRGTAQALGLSVGPFRGRTLIPVALLLLVVLVPLTFASVGIARDQLLASQAGPVAQSWADAAGWDVTSVEALNGTVIVSAFGPPPSLDPETLRQQLDSAGMADANLVIRLVVGGSRVCPAGSTTCTVSTV